MMQAQVTDLRKKVADLKKSKDAIILAHNYQIPEVQDVADYVGDSLGLARKAANTENKRIVFLWRAFYGRNCLNIMSAF